MRFIRRFEEIPANAHVQGQPRALLEIVLEIGGIFMDAISRFQRNQAPLGHDWNAQDDVGKCIVGGEAIREKIPSARRKRRQTVVLAKTGGDTRFEGMPSGDPAKVVGQLRGIEMVSTRSTQSAAEKSACIQILDGWKTRSERIRWR